MTAESYIEIDGFRIMGDAKGTLALGSLVEALIKHLADTGSDSIWLPMTGSVAGQDTYSRVPVLQRVRIHRGSNVHTTIVSDGSISTINFSEITEIFNDLNRQLGERFLPTDDEGDERSE